jgi:hypothetical protein
VRSLRRLPVGPCAAVLCAALALASPAAAAGAPTPQNASPRPNPQKLWKHYPLAPKPSASPERSRDAAAPTASSSSGGHSVILPLLWIACIVVGLAWALSFARLIRRPQRPHAARHRALGADDLPDALIEAVRGVTRTARQQVQQSMLGRARKSRY